MQPTTSPLPGLWRYGLPGLALAFVALPLYVQLPHYYATTFGMPLATLGALLLGARLFDALIDPLLGRWADRLLQRPAIQVLRHCIPLAAVLLLAFAGLVFPALRSPVGLLIWTALCLLATYTTYSALSIVHQAWGAQLGGDATQRSRVVAWREGLGLAGVLLASLAPPQLGWPATVALLGLALLCGLWAWSTAPRPEPQTVGITTQPEQAARPLAQAAFRSLLGVFIVNGLASAIPATLLLFFVQDRLQLPATDQSLFLGCYFACAAIGMPLWLRLVARTGLVPGWGFGMVLSVLTFGWAATLGAGDSTAFALVCALSGLALGADLAIPAAVLAGVIRQLGDSGRGEGIYFGWWNLAAKLNLALAAGLTLPLLQLLGYAPGRQDATSLHALTLAYCVLPCALKLCAAALLWRFHSRFQRTAP